MIEFPFLLFQLDATLNRTSIDLRKEHQMRIVVIGGTGHIGTYLVPRLVEAGHEVIVISRNISEPYQPHIAWQSVRRVQVDRDEAENKREFGLLILALNPDVVIDLICFRLESARELVEALTGTVSHFLHCGTIWVHGPSDEVPTREEDARQPFGDYGYRKAAIERYLLTESRRSGFPATIIHPGHIVGQGWVPLNPQGNFNPHVFEKLASGYELTLPNFGLETVHHVHADDVALAFQQAMNHWSAAVGESFHAVSPAALTLRGFARAVAGWFGREPKLRFLPWEEWRCLADEKDAEETFDHIAHSPNCSIEKARRLIEYNPRYTSLQAVKESVSWLIAHHTISIPAVSNRDSEINSQLFADQNP
jgi:nucleoside-diphosphate-sugar epimerase